MSSHSRGAECFLPSEELASDKQKMENNDGGESSKIISNPRRGI